MALQSPPSYVAWSIQRWDATAWSRFINGANRALGAGGARWISSWWRTPQENSALEGSAGRSQHLLGLALDAGPPSRALERAFYAAGFSYAYSTERHTHAQLYRAGTIPDSVFRSVGV